MVDYQDFSDIFIDLDNILFDSVSLQIQIRFCKFAQTFSLTVLTQFDIFIDLDSILFDSTTLQI